VDPGRYDPESGHGELPKRTEMLLYIVVGGPLAIGALIWLYQLCFSSRG
jgi:hypothetical protein